METRTIAEKAYGLLWRDRATDARILLLNAIGKDGQRRGIQSTIDSPEAPHKREVSVSAIWLKTIGDDVIVEAEIGGRWVELIRERSDGAYSHIIEGNGVFTAYVNALQASE